MFVSGSYTCSVVNHIDCAESSDRRVILRCESPFAGNLSVVIDKRSVTVTEFLYHQFTESSLDVLKPCLQPDRSAPLNPTSAFRKSTSCVSATHCLCLHCSELTKRGSFFSLDVCNVRNIKTAAAMLMSSSSSSPSSSSSLKPHNMY